MSAINFNLTAQSFAEIIQKIQDQCTRAEKGEKVDLKPTVKMLAGLVQRLNKDGEAINTGIEITPEVRKKYDIYKRDLTDLNARVKALSAKANITPAWVKPVAYAALTLGVIAFSAFIVQKTGVLSSPPTPTTPGSSPMPSAGGNEQTFIDALNTWCEEKNGEEEYTNRKKAETQLINCYASSATDCSLRSLKLTSLPSAISNLTSLTFLDLGHNQLSSPPDFRNLTSLTFLDLGSNQLSSPPDLRNLTSLTVLDLKNNQLSSPPDIRNLTSLRFLYLGYNRLSSCPDTSQLTNLRHLDLANNNISSCPGISQLTSLSNLYLRNNPLSPFPDIRNLTNLEYSDFQPESNTKYQK